MAHINFLLCYIYATCHQSRASWMQMGNQRQTYVHTHTDTHADIYRDFSSPSSWIHKTVCVYCRAEQTNMTASWQLLYTGSLLCVLDIQYILKVIQERWGLLGVGGRRTTWINRNQTLSGGGFGTLSEDMGEGVRGYGNRVWQGGHDGQQPLSERQVVMRESGEGRRDVVDSCAGRWRGPEAVIAALLAHRPPVRAAASFIHTHMHDSRHANAPFCGNKSSLSLDCGEGA